jgi:hypothetical protein
LSFIVLGVFLLFTGIFALVLYMYNT